MEALPKKYLLSYCLRVASWSTLALLIFTMGGCDFYANSETEEDPPLPKASTLIASMDGNAPGLWLFDAETLERTAVVETENHVPVGVAFSPSYERWYLSWSTGSHLDGDARNVLVALDPAEGGRFTKRASWPDAPDVEGGVGNASLIYEPANDHLVAYGSGSGRVQFFDPEALEPVRELSVGTSENSYVPAAAVAEKRKKIYFAVDTEGERIYVYDTTEKELNGAISLSDHPVLQESAFSDLAISMNERYLFGTTFLSPGGPGRFFVVDLESGQILFKGEAGNYSNLAVSPNGRYVYIDCPAGGALRQFPPTGQLLRFDVEQREMEVFVEDSEALGLGDYVLQATQITMLPNAEAVVIRNRAGAPTGDPALLKLDAETGSVLATYTLPRDDQDHATAWVRQLHFGVTASE